MKEDRKMLAKLLITTAVSGLMVSGAFSLEQTLPQPPQAPGAKATVAPVSSAKFITSQSPDQWVFTKFRGSDVIGPDNAAVGSVNDLLFDHTGKIIAK
jgi:hypothetical protein